MPAFDFILGGRYKLLGPLGEGGMAAVYRGRDLRLNREIAIKVLHDDLMRDPSFLARFQREAQFVASLSHPNIVPVYDVGEENGTHYIVMEYVRGRTLKEAIDIEGRLRADRAVAIMHPVLEALGYAHERGLVHRDVKPHNILLTIDGTPRLADFGIAHLADGSTTRTAAILGSAHYLSPEQSRGEEATASSDIYAAGIVMYEMLAGHPPFDGPNALAIAHQHLHVAPTPLADCAERIDPQIEQAVLRALAKDPVGRFERAADFAAALNMSPALPDSTLVQPLLPQEAAVPRRNIVVRAADPPAITPIVVRRSARKTWLLAAAVALVLLVAAYIAGSLPTGYQLPSYPSLPYIGAPALVAVIVLLSWLQDRSRVYTLDDGAAVVQWGVIGHRRYGVPLRSISMLELKQSPIDRVLGVGTVDLHARDELGAVKHVLLEDLPHPRSTYDELMRLLARVAVAPVQDRDQ